MRKRHFWAMAGLFAVLCLATPAKADIIDCTIPDIQDTSSAMRDTLVATDTVRVVGRITGHDGKATGFGFYIEDDAFSVYRGVLVFTGGEYTFSTMGLARGDQVRVTGRLTEFQGGTEIISRTGSAFGTPPLVEFLGAGAVPGPTNVAPGQIARNGILSEQYEGMYCNMNVTMRVGTSYPTDPRLPFFTMLCVENTGPSLDSVLVDMNTLANPGIAPPPPGTVLTLLRGIVDQRSAGYNLQIRDGNDIILPTPPNLVNAYAISNDTIRVDFDRPMDETTTEEVSNYFRGTLKGIDAAILQANGQSVHLACALDPQVSPELEEVFVQNVESTGGGTMVGTQSDEFIAGMTSIVAMQTPPTGEEYVGVLGTDTTQFLGQTITTRGIVTARFGSLVFVQDAAGGLRSGFKFFAPSGPMAVGDDVTIVGVPIEFFDETEISGALFERNHGPGVPPVALTLPSLVPLNTNVGPPGREDYEHIVVRIEDVAVIDENAGFGEFVVVKGTEFLNPASPETLHVDDRGETAGFYSYFSLNGDTFSYIEAPVEISFGATKLEPRSLADLGFGPVVSAENPDLAFALHAPRPNPASLSRGAVEIAFSLPKGGAAQVRLYDIRGRLVKTLTDGTEFAPGRHTVQWDGRDAGGGKVGSGIYFVQLKLGNAVAANKVVVAE